MNASTSTPAWQASVQEAMARIKAIHQREGAGSSAALEQTAQVLQGLASRRELFSFEHFGLPAEGGGDSARYALYAEADQQYALYLNALLPGKTSVPHNHGTWAVIVAVEGEEVNRRYAVSDGTSRVVQSGEFIVRPGHPAIYGPDDIHSIHVLADRPALLFHLYGRALETLTDRLAFDLETGQSYPYNAKHYRPNAT